MIRHTVTRLLTTAVLTSTLAVGVVQHDTLRTASAVALPADVRWMNLGWPVRGQNAGDVAGTAVAMSADGHVMVVGLPGDDAAGVEAGAVRVLEWNDTAWVQRGNADFTGVAGEGAGDTVALSGDGTTMAFLAPTTTPAGGRVEVHRWSNGTWTPLGDPFTGTPGAQMGLGALTEDGSTLVLANPFDDMTGTDTGSVQVFDWNGTTWTQRGATLRGALGDLLGGSAAITPDGQTLVVGALLGDRGVQEAGDVLVFDWNGTAWAPRPTLSGTVAFEYFGASVAVDHDGDSIAVGAPADASGGAYAGRVRVFDWDGTQWVARGGPIDGSPDDELGTEVALDGAGDTLAISSPLFDGTAGADSGHVQVFDWTGAAWQRRAWALEGDAAGNEASAVALSADGTTVAVGQAGDDVNGANAGSVSVFTSAAIRPWGTPLVGSVDFAEAGRSTALNTAGDTVAVGMPGPIGGPFPGRVAVYRQIQGMWTQLGTTFVGSSAGDLFGADIALDADGDTIVIGAPNDDTGAPDAGRVFVYDWNGTLWQPRGTALDGVAANSDFGAAVDIDDAGTTVVVGAPATDLAGNDVGQTTVWTWSGAVWQLRGFPVAGDGDGNYSGAAVAISGDGSTVAVGDPQYEVMQLIVVPSEAAVHPAVAPNNIGRVRAFRFSGGNWQQVGVELLGVDPEDRLGTAVDLDYNGTTLAVGIPGDDPTGVANAGSAVVRMWDGAAWVAQGTTIAGEAAGDALGTSVALNDDGSIVAVGAPGNDGAGPDAGHTRLLQFEGGTWSALNADLDGLMVGEGSGSSVSLSADGSVVAVGSPARLGPRPGDGAVTVSRMTWLSTPGRPPVAAAQPAGTDRITLTWTRQPSTRLEPISSSDIEISGDGGETWSAATRTSTDPSGTTLTGLTPGTTYRVRVRDVNAQGAGPWHAVGAVTSLNATAEAITRPTTTVLTGEDAYELAVAISRHHITSTVDTVYLITAENFPDAIVGGVAAARAQGPVLLTSRTSLPEVTRRELERLQPRHIVIVGGTNAVDEQVASELATLARMVTRVSGADRYDTAAAVARTVARPGVDVVYVASGTSHADGMVVAPLAAAHGAPLVLSAPDRLPTVTRDVLTELAPGRIIVVGGPHTIGSSVMDELSQLSPTVERLYGANLGRTALAVAVKHWITLNNPVITVDRNRAGDGLALTPLAAARHFPVLITEGRCTSVPIADELRRRSNDVLVVTTGSAEDAVAALDMVCPVE